MRRLAIACVCALPALAHANPADVFDFGSRAAAMAGAHAALASDGSANYYNPAGLARGEDLRIDVGYQAGQPMLSLNGRDSGVDGTHGLTVGLVAPGHLLGGRFAFGAALFLPDDRITRSRSLAYAQPRWVYYDNRTQRILLSANLAVRIYEGLYLGGGVTFMARTAGTVELRGLVAVIDTDVQSQLVTAVSVDLLAVRYPQFGVAWEAKPWLTFGATYRHGFLLSLDQGFAITGDIGNPGTPPILSNGRFVARTLSADLFQPWQLTFGSAAKLPHRVQLALDVTFARWSDFTAPASVVEVNFDVGQFNSLIHLAPPRVYPAPGFRDIFIPRVGVEWRALDREKLALDLRAGYRYEPSPAPEQTGESNFADADKHRFSVGAGLELRRFTQILPRPLSIDAHAAFTWLPARANRKSDPLDPVGDFVAAGTVVEGGVTTRWSF